MSASDRLERLAERPGSFPGALLLAGPSADGVDAEARRLAARLLCPGDDPNGSCDSCRRVAAGTHPDLLVVEPEGVAIKVDRVRQALVFAAGRPYEAARRVALVLRAEKLGVESANALLKALEEPGDCVRWILTTERPESLLITIRSRCVTALVPAPSRGERAAAWKARGFSEEDAADLALFGVADAEKEDAEEELVRRRAARERVVLAVAGAVSDGGAAQAVLLAEVLSKSDRASAGLLAEVLADAALAAAGTPERMRHRALGGPIAGIAARRSSEALRNAAVAAADAPEDSRRGNRRLHFEALLLKLVLAGRD
ncbi:MAG: hypothetical protein ABI592_03315 [Acidobacteriota bacterium]